MPFSKHPGKDVLQGLMRHKRANSPFPGIAEKGRRFFKVIRRYGKPEVRGFSLAKE
jgi:hypothetical protein